MVQKWHFAQKFRGWNKDTVKLLPQYHREVIVVHEHVEIATEGFFTFSSVYVTKRVHKMPPEKTKFKKLLLQLI